jgi:sensor histidine kinase YesM
VGIWNTNKMIHNLYGNEYGLKIDSKPGEGTVVTVTLPVRKEEDYVESYDS